MIEKDKSDILSKEAFEELLLEVMDETGDWSMSDPMKLIAMVESKRRSLKRAENLIQKYEQAKSTGHQAGYQE